MSGQSGSRGYLIQAVIAVLNSLNNSDWTAMMIEPNVEYDKVDILWIFPDKVKCTQVKSSQNQITLRMVKAWVNDLKQLNELDIPNIPKAIEYELLLIGPVSKEVASIQEILEVQVPTPQILNTDALLEQASSKLDKFLERRSIAKVPVFVREILINALVSRFSSFSTSGEVISRADFTNMFQEWVLSIYPGSINQASENLKLEFQSKNRIEEARFKLKYDACLEALSIIDAYFSHVLSVEGGLKPVLQEVSTAKARECHSKLILSCENTEVPESFIDLLIHTNKKKPTDSLNELRNLIRTELGFGDSILLSRESAWLWAVTGDPKSDEST